MIKHIQKHLHVPEVSSGSCYPTVYACLLDLDLDRVPHFNLMYYTSKEKENIKKYLERRFLDGVDKSEFQGESYHLDNYNHFLSLSINTWDLIREFWLASQGVKEINIPDINDWLTNNTNVPYLVSGKSSRGVDHIVIYMNGELYHDPHPSGEGLVELWKEYPYSILVSI